MTAGVRAEDRVVEARVAEIILGESVAIHRIREQIVKVAPVRLPVLIQGPTGSGKELVAQALHAVSGRSGELVAFSVAALPEPLFEDALFGHVKGAFTSAAHDARGYLAEADQGTAFLDEIGALSPTLQPKLLRVIETHTFRPVGDSRDRQSDFRLVSATNESVAALVAAGRFRTDLAERLSAFVIEVPPLAARPEDIPRLVAHFIQHSAANSAGRAITVSPVGMRLLQAYDWPTNVRQLRNVIERALVEAGPAATRLGVEVVRAAMQTIGVGVTGHDAGEGDGSRTHLVATLAACDWEVERAAAVLGIDRATVYRWMRRLGVRRPVIRGRRGG